MIKASGISHSGRPFFVLGLSGENVARLMADEPIKVDLAQLGGPAIDILLVGGRTENDITNQLVAVGALPPHLARRTTAGDNHDG